MTLAFLLLLSFYLIFNYTTFIYLCFKKKFQILCRLISYKCISINLICLNSLFVFQQASGGSPRGLEGGIHANNFATIRTTSIVRKQIKEHERSNDYRNFTVYKRLRKTHQKELQIVCGLFATLNLSHT